VGLGYRFVCAHSGEALEEEEDEAHGAFGSNNTLTHAQAVALFCGIVRAT